MASHSDNETLKPVPTVTCTEPNAQLLERLQTASSVVIPKEVFETMYLGPTNKSHEHLRKTFGSPTPMALLGFLLASNTLGFNLMGWHGAGGGGAAIIGLCFFFGGMLQIIGSLLEWVMGNTFPCVVFASYGAFWLSFGVTLKPDFNAQAYFGTTEAGQEEFAASFGFVYFGMCLATVFFTIAALRINIVFFFIFFFIELAYAMLFANYMLLGEGKTEEAAHCETAAAVFIFVFCAFGWYLFLHLILVSVDFPIVVPVGDLSKKFKGRSDRLKEAGSAV